MLAALRFMVRYILILSTIIGLTVMAVCTAFIVSCIIHGAIKINIVRINADKEKN